MFRPDIGVIRAVHSDRIRRDIVARVRPEMAPRESAYLAARRRIGHWIVRQGARIAAETANEQELDLAGSQ